MKESLYRLVFKGELVPGFNQSQVETNFQSAFGLDAGQTARLFARSRENPEGECMEDLPYELALKMREKMLGVGMLASLEPMSAAVSGPGQTVPPVIGKLARRDISPISPAAATTASPAPATTPAAAVSVGREPSYQTTISSPATTPEQIGQGLNAQGPGLQQEINDRQKAQLAAGGMAIPGSSAPEASPARLPQDTASGSRLAGAGQRRALGIRFNGQGGEYFRIWIVNILLSIVTLGVYSAWAKVRNRRYMYGNTRVGEHSFDYDASPIAILKGRALVAPLLLFYLLADFFSEWLGLLAFIVFIIALPWLVCRAMSFNYHHTLYRNIRFGFAGKGKYGEAFKVFILWPLAGVLSLGLLFPYALYRQKIFLISNLRYGTSFFKPDIELKAFYLIYIKSSAIFAGAVVSAVLLSLVGMVLAGSPVLGLITGPLVMLVFLFGFAFLNANIGNLVYNNSSLAGHGFFSSLATLPLAKIYLINALTVFVSLGLAIPWAKVRLASYRAASLNLIATGPLDLFVAEQQERVSALGEELGDAFDLDLGL